MVVFCNTCRVLMINPYVNLVVKIGKFVKKPAWNEVILQITDKTFDRTFDKQMSGAAQLRAVLFCPSFSRNSKDSPHVYGLPLVG